MDGFVCGTGFATGVATRASHAVNVRPQFAVMGTMGRTTIGPGAVRGPRMQAAVQVSVPVPRPGNLGISVRSCLPTGCQWAGQLERPLRALESFLRDNYPGNMAIDRHTRSIVSWA
ncbi:MAG: hypothetical protein QOH09_4122 [Pseudonocardiales bacterium]|nr:hypothetical protein [Pseudonocardiales bacterium]